MKRTAILALFAQLWSATALAYDLGAANSRPGEPGMTSEFVYRTDSDEALIPVYLLGAVAKPGLYHIPANTDLVGLLTLAGGATQGAQTDKILVKGASGGDRQLRFDLEEAVQKGAPVKLALASNDLVYVTPGKPPITGEVLTALGIVTGILGIVATSIVLSQNLKK